MGSLHQIKSSLLNDGKITACEVEMIKDQMALDGILDFDDARLLIELMRDAKEVCSEFDEFFFPCLRHIILQDGRVGMDEQFLLLQMLYADGEIREGERRFLKELYRDTAEISPEFQQLCETALNAPDKNWNLD